MELFGKYFVFEVRIFIEILKDIKHAGKNIQMNMQIHNLYVTVYNNNPYKIYSVSRLDVFELGHLHSAQVVKCFFIFLSQ